MVHVAVQSGEHRVTLYPGRAADHGVWVQMICLRLGAQPEQAVNEFGYPRPGVQSPTPAVATADHYFVDDATWNASWTMVTLTMLSLEVVIAPLAYVDEALKRDPHRKNTHLGAGSTFWSAWCPTPHVRTHAKLPASLKETAASHEFWDKCKALLHVTPADKISDQVFGELQTDIDDVLERGRKAGKIPTADVTESAPLAFSTPGPLLAIQERQTALANRGEGSPLMIAVDCVVKKFHIDEVENHAVTVLETSRGDLCFPNGKTNVILAAEHAISCGGQRLTGHFLSHIVARYPMGRGALWGSRDIKKDRLEIAANYISGRAKPSDHQYHIQGMPPDYAAAATAEQLKGSEKHIVLVCATLGELDENNPESWVRRNPQDPDVTTNVKLQVTLTQVDRDLWDVMDQATFEAIEVMADSEAHQLEYWHEDESGTGTGTWNKMRPETKEIRIPGVVHEASTLYMGPKSDPHAALDEHYRPHGCKNVYVTGGAIFPTAGSWNPTLTMCGYAQDLARKIVQPKRS
ncbi:hypothetical protein B0H14DRAFT_3108503 [Mycena olivaceomarginata]|nr:hypothetical protein B0H14DRAFT_3108503 [Mycena olivaceomarginata]